MPIERPPPHTTDHGTYTVTGLPAFADNYIWVLVAPTGDSSAAAPIARVVVVDPGDAAPVIEYCRRHGLVPDQVWLTHHHADHAGGVPELQDWVRRRGGHLQVFGPAAEHIGVVNQPLQGGEQMNAAPLGNVAVLSLPGHTSGHLAYLIAAQNGSMPPALFSGDVLFGLGCGRLFEGTAAQMFASLEQLRALPQSTRIYCAHEYTLLNLPFALAVDPDNPGLIQRAETLRSQSAAGEPTVPLLLATECATNPFLRADHAALAHAVDGGSGSLVPTEVFTRLRAMRDNFRAKP